MTGKSRNPAANLANYTVSKRKKPRKAKSGQAGPPESQRAEAITVFWMTSLLGTVLSEAGVLLARLWMMAVGPFPELELLSGLLLLIGCATGLVCLALVPLVLRWRRIPPPKAILRFALFAGLLPWMTFIGLMYFQH